MINFKLLTCVYTFLIIFSLIFTSNAKRYSNENPSKYLKNRGSEQKNLDKRSTLNNAAKSPISHDNTPKWLPFEDTQTLKIGPISIIVERISLHKLVVNYTINGTNFVNDNITARNQVDFDVIFILNEQTDTQTSYMAKSLRVMRREIDFTVQPDSKYSLEVKVAYTTKDKKLKKYLKPDEIQISEDILKSIADVNPRDELAYEVDETLKIGKIHIRTYIDFKWKEYREENVKLVINYTIYNLNEKYFSADNGIKERQINFKAEVMLNEGATERYTDNDEFNIVIENVNTPLHRFFKSKDGFNPYKKYLLKMRVTYFSKHEDLQTPDEFVVSENIFKTIADRNKEIRESTTITELTSESPSELTSAKRLNKILTEATATESIREETTNQLATAEEETKTDDGSGTAEGEETTKSEITSESKITDRLTSEEPTTEETKTTEGMTDTEATTTEEATTPEAATSQALTTEETTTTEEVKTSEKSTTTEEVMTSEESTETVGEPKTTELITSEASTTEKATITEESEESSTTEEVNTSEESSTTEEVMTSEESTTTEKVKTSVESSTTEEVMTSEEATTIEAVTSIATSTEEATSPEEIKIIETVTSETTTATEEAASDATTTEETTSEGTIAQTSENPQSKTSVVTDPNETTDSSSVAVSSTDISSSSESVKEKTSETQSATSAETTSVYTTIATTEPAVSSTTTSIPAVTTESEYAKTTEEVTVTKRATTEPNTEAPTTGVFVNYTKPAVNKLELAIGSVETKLMRPYPTVISLDYTVNAFKLNELRNKRSKRHVLSSDSSKEVFEMTVESVLEPTEGEGGELKQTHVLSFNMVEDDRIKSYMHVFDKLNPYKNYKAKFNILYHNADILPDLQNEEKSISSDIIKDLKSSNENSEPSESPTNETGWKIAVGVVVGALALIIIMAILIIRNNKRKLKHNVTNKNSARNGNYLDDNVAIPRGAIGLKELSLKSNGVDNEGFQNDNGSASKNSTLSGNDFVVTKYSLPIAVAEFNSVYNSMKENNEAKIREEFKKVKQITETKILALASQRSSRMTNNRLKNRFANIVPYDHSRVKLSKIGDDISSDYINANFVPGFTSKKEYIATQGPLRKTLNDFWRMICEYNISVIVNLTQSVEGEVIKCETYWPTLYENGAEANLEDGSSKPSMTIGSYNITLNCEKSVGDFTVRDLEVNSGHKTLAVKQFHLTHWPDFESPRNARYLLNLIRIVRQHCDEKQLESNTRNAPILVHCSAGVGRTGTFIAVDRLYQELVYRRSPQIDIFGTVMDMRQHRVHMVQSEDQYIFVYECVASLVDELPKGSNTTRSKASTQGSRSSNVTLTAESNAAEGTI